jgi:hypothetical protein
VAPVASQSAIAYTRMKEEIGRDPVQGSRSP